MDGGTTFLANLFMGIYALSLLCLSVMGVLFLVQLVVDADACGDLVGEDGAEEYNKHAGRVCSPTGRTVCERNRETITDRRG